MGLGSRVTSLFNPQVFFSSGNEHLSGFKMGRSRVKSSLKPHVCLQKRV